MVTQKLYRNENGLVSIMIASVLMVIMALITLGFTRIVQNEQRQSVDNQLSKQAFYAAESGVNIAASTPGFPGTSVKDDCDVSGYGNGDVSSNGDIQFTCLLINPTPNDIVFGNDSITTNKSKVVPIRADSYPSKIIFEWDDSNNDNVEGACGSNLDFDPDSTTWDKIAPLRLDLIGVPTGTINRGNLIANQFNAIFYPCNSSTSVGVAYSSAQGPGDIGEIIPVNCQNAGDYECKIEITGVPAGMREFYARFNSIYSDINVRITAEDAAGNRPLFANSQAVVDSTGKAVDVFRRVQARVPLYDAFVLPNASIQTVDEVCKLYAVEASVVVDGCP